MKLTDCIPITGTRWVTGLVVCEECGYEWVGVWSILAKRLEC